MLSNYKHSFSSFSLAFQDLPHHTHNPWHIGNLVTGTYSPPVTSNLMMTLLCLLTLKITQIYEITSSAVFHFMHQHSTDHIFVLNNNKKNLFKANL